MHFRDFTLNDIRYERISKREARKYYNRGRRVYCLACKLNPLSPLVHMCEMQYPSNADFDAVVNAYEWYNCNNECGRYAAFYVPVLIIPTWYKDSVGAINGTRYHLFWLTSTPDDDTAQMWRRNFGCVMLKSHPQYAPEIKSSVLAIPLDGCVKAYYA